jgi:diadenosine tetraphosphate (Ap4A) HIT family hydrolase
MAFQIPEHLIIKTTDHWIVNHRVDSKLPGYLMIASRADTAKLSDLSAAALGELGKLLAEAQKILQETLHAEHVYLSRFGHQPGLSIHFHVIPIYGWVKAAFTRDPRYAIFKSFYATGANNSEFDGSELTFYIWRELCESANPPAIEGPSTNEVIQLLRKNMPGKS